MTSFIDGDAGLSYFPPQRREQEEGQMLDTLLEVLGMHMSSRPMDIAELDALVDGYRCRPIGTHSRSLNELREELDAWLGTAQQELSQLRGTKDNAAALQEQPRRSSDARQATIRDLADARMDAIVDEAELVVACRLTDLLLVFAGIMERTIGIFPYDVQLLAALYLYDGASTSGEVASKQVDGSALEMDTGEGKTYVLGLVAAAQAVTHRLARDRYGEERQTSLVALGFEFPDVYGGLIPRPRPRSVHVLTANDYLVRRDAERLRPFFECLGLSVTSIQSNDERTDGVRAQVVGYSADVVYGTAEAFVWDYLHGQSTNHPNERFQSGPDFLLLDEVDHVLFDARDTPYVISQREDYKPDYCTEVYQTYRMLEELRRNPSLLEWDESRAEYRLSPGAHSFLTGCFEPLSPRVQEILAPCSESILELVELVETGGLIDEDHLSRLLDELARRLAEALPHPVLALFGLMRGAGLLATETPLDTFETDPRRLVEWLAELAAELAREAVQDSAITPAVATALRQLGGPAEDSEQGPRIALSLVLLADEWLVQPLLKRIQEIVDTPAEAGQVLVRYQEFASILASPVHQTFSTWVDQGYGSWWTGDSQIEFSLTDAGKRTLETLFDAIDKRESRESFGIRRQFIDTDLVVMLVTTLRTSYERFQTIFENVTSRLAEEEPQLVQQLEEALEQTEGVFESVHNMLKPSMDIPLLDQSVAEEGLATLTALSVAHPELRDLVDALRTSLVIMSEIAPITARLRELQEAWSQGDETLQWLKDRTMDLLVDAMSRVGRRLAADSVGSKALQAVMLAYTMAALSQVELPTPPRPADAPPPAAPAQLQPMLRHLAKTVAFILGEPPEQTLQRTGEMLEQLRQPASELLKVCRNADSVIYQWLWDVLPGVFLRPQALGHRMEFMSWATGALLGRLERARVHGLIDDVGRVADYRSWLNDAESAMLVQREDVDYLVDAADRTEGSLDDPYTSRAERFQIYLLDQSTGRLKPSSRYSNRLHAFLEARYNLLVRPPSHEVREITMRNFVRRYRRAAGMSGTLFERRVSTREGFEHQHRPAGIEAFWSYLFAAEDAPESMPGTPETLAEQRNAKRARSAVLKELASTHPRGLTYCATVPRNYPRRLELSWPDIVCNAEEEQVQVIACLAEALSRAGRPVLVQEPNLGHSERIARVISDRLGREIPVLNARPEHASHEAQLIARAGSAGSILVATQMAGRGVDIQLDEEARRRGGLFVIASAHSPRSQRLDYQLLGRAGRQADPGDALFVLSLGAILHQVDERFLVELKPFFDPETEPSTLELVEAALAVGAEGSTERDGDENVGLFGRRQSALRKALREYQNLQVEEFILSRQRMTEEQHRRRRIEHADFDEIERTEKQELLRLRRLTQQELTTCPACRELSIPADPEDALLLRAAEVDKREGAGLAPLPGGAAEIVCRRCATCLEVHRQTGQACTQTRCYQKGPPNFYVSPVVDGPGASCIHNQVFRNWISRTGGTSVLRQRLEEALVLTLNDLVRLRAKDFLRTVIEANVYNTLDSDYADEIGLALDLRLLTGFAVKSHTLVRALRHSEGHSRGPVEVLRDTLISEHPQLESYEVSQVLGNILGEPPASAQEVVDHYLAQYQRVVYGIDRSPSSIPPEFDAAAGLRTRRARRFEDAIVRHAVDTGWPELNRRLAIFRSFKRSELGGEGVRESYSRMLRVLCSSNLAYLRLRITSRLFLPVRFEQRIRRGGEPAHLALFDELSRSGSWDATEILQLTRAFPKARDTPAMEVLMNLLANSETPPLFRMSRQMPLRILADVYSGRRTPDRSEVLRGFDA